MVVVGGGLAGRAVASAMTGRCPLIWADSPSPESATPAAQALLANPMMSQKANPVWRAREAMEALGEWHSEHGVEPVARGVLRPARDWKQMDIFRGRSERHADLASYHSQAESRERWPFLHAPHGTLFVPSGLAFRPEDFRSPSPSRAWKLTGFAEAAGEVTSTFETPDGPGTVRSGVLVLAMGSALATMPGTASLPLHPIKGQTAHTPVRLPERAPCISGGGYTVPVPDGTVVGSTFEHQFEDPHPNPAAARDLVARAANNLPLLADAPVDRMRAGVRVTVPGTRLPMVGPLPGHSRVWIVTGLGSKGLLMSALIRRHFADWLAAPDSIPHEIRVRERSA